MRRSRSSRSILKARLAGSWRPTKWRRLRRRRFHRRSNLRRNDLRQSGLRLNDQGLSDRAFPVPRDRSDRRWSGLNPRIGLRRKRRRISCWHREVLRNCRWQRRSRGRLGIGTEIRVVLRDGDGNEADAAADRGGFRARRLVRQFGRPARRAELLRLKPVMRRTRQALPSTRVSTNLSLRNQWRVRQRRLWE